MGPKREAPLAANGRAPKAQKSSLETPEVLQKSSLAKRCIDILKVLNFDAIMARCPTATKALLREYQRFLALKVVLKDFDASVLSPPPEVDTLWHAHILDTKHYRATFIDHNPEGGLDVVARHARRSTALAQYEQLFGAAPNLWTAAALPARTSEQDANEVVTIKVCAQDGTHLFFKINRDARLEKLKAAFCRRQKVRADSVRFLFDGQLIFPEQTPKELDIEDGDIIDVTVNQEGC